MIGAAWNILGQEKMEGWGGLVYLLIFVLFPMLNVLGKKLRERFGKEKDDSEPAAPATVQVPKRRSRELVPPVAKAKPVSRAEARPVAVPPAKPIPPRPAAPPSRSPLETPVPQPPPRGAARTQPRPAETGVHPARARPVKRALTDRPSTEPAVQSTPWYMPAAAPKADTGIRARRTKFIPAKLSMSEWRRAVILAEILHRPLALRDPDSQGL